MRSDDRDLLLAGGVTLPHRIELLDFLESLERKEWVGTVFRYGINDRQPNRENTLGARWNPRELGAIYTSLERDTVLAELGHFFVNLDPRPSKMRIVLYTLRVALEGILDLGSLSLLGAAGVSEAHLSSPNFEHCQAVGAAAAWLSAGGLLVPSARAANGTNLVIYPLYQPPDYDFEIVNEEPIDTALWP